MAVLSVILFHAAIPGFGGGFVGVDMFFVISGHLITGSITEELAAGTFSLGGFYERRIRRILPALAVVIVCIQPFAWRLMFPEELSSASDSLMGIALFSSNVVFWLESGYFATAAEFKPLLHTWSLAVEEQFYILFPLLLLGIARFLPRWRKAVLWTVLASSLALSEWGVVSHPSWAYYLLPTRAWELLLGAVLSLTPAAPQDEGRTLRNEIWSITGLAMIIVAVVSYDKATPFPGLFALIPTFGTGFVIASAVSGTLVFRVLASPPLVGVGLLSYSAYLWHQPLFALARYQSLAPPSLGGALLLCVLTLFIAYFSWRFVEVPSRSATFVSRRQTFALAAATSAIIGGIGIIVHMHRGFPSRFAFPSSTAHSFELSRRAAECFNQVLVHQRVDWLCNIGAQGDSVDFLITGDSHALSLLDTFDDVARANGTHGVFAGLSGCPPLRGVYVLRPGQTERDCHQLNERVYNYVRERRIKTVILVARWTYYTDGGYDGANIAYLGLTPDIRPTVALSREAFAVGVDRTFSAFATLGTHILVVLQVPDQLYPPQQVFTKLFAEKSGSDSSILRTLSVSVTEHLRLQRYSRSKIAALAARYAEVRIINLDPQYCDSLYCLIGDDLKSRYHDREHLSLQGAELARTPLREALNAALSQKVVFLNKSTVKPAPH